MPKIEVGGRASEIAYEEALEEVIPWNRILSDGILKIITEHAGAIRSTPTNIIGTMFVAIGSVIEKGLIWRCPIPGRVI